MTQLHKRFTDDQVRVLFRGYCQGLLKRAEIQEMLDIGKKNLKRTPETGQFSYNYLTIRACRPLNGGCAPTAGQTRGLLLCKGFHSSTASKNSSTGMPALAISVRSVPHATSE